MLMIKSLTYRLKILLKCLTIKFQKVASIKKGDSLRITFLKASERI